ncbi:c-di-AMP phosphodiesterase-like protein [Acetoanaerobium pronyense]|uniref:Cyclic-di-AMP phosphodiesterase n=1 Tax=Acetoanaerobium pronyense TaxID=1482736 RepID=A0ABS4KL74_9FIRM|nr:DHH family phosphoesterase [Acetoanaerobium pronyense]MBP2028542.1 c-di-AMP phosphodiesterase-like protein [Acetoanaerobium pronyense]
MQSTLKVNIPESKVYIILVGILSTIVVYYNIFIGIPSLLVFFYLIYHNYKALANRNREWIKYIEDLSLNLEHMTKETLLSFPVAMCIIDNEGSLRWYNDKFLTLSKSEEMIEKNIKEVFPSYDSSKIFLDENEAFQTQIEADKKIYEVKYNIIERENEPSLAAIYFFDVTELRKITKEYEMIKPVIMSIQVDSFDEVLNSASEDVRPIIEAEVERTIKSWADRFKGAIRKTVKDKYIVIVDEGSLLELEKDKFSILDDIRKIEMGNTIPLTLSIGASSLSTDLSSTLKNAVTSLDLALGRGGDQAVIKRDERSIFYGGRSKAVEKKTKVKARIIAHALRDLVNESEKVIIMGHHYPDLDALGAAVGVYGICRMLGKSANIVLENSNTSIDVLHNRLIQNDSFKDAFIKREDALQSVDDKTLLIIVDTHRPSFTEYPSLIEKCDKIVLIDHHRRGVEFIDKAVLIYHETYASSASEMVTELIQYVKDRPYIDNLTAESLLSGIALDTKNFTFKTGVRTFEAAAFLRKFGADTVAVKQLFQGDLDSFLVKAEGIKNAKILGGKIALSTCPENLENPSLIAAQVADELLNIRGVEASFVVARRSDGLVFISARSLGSLNVHLFMEKLGGGGHIDVAGAQLKDTTTDEAMEKVEELIMEYFKEDDE